MCGSFAILYKRRANCEPLKAQSEYISRYSSEAQGEDTREKAIKLEHLPDNSIYSTKSR